MFKKYLCKILFLSLFLFLLGWIDAAQAADEGDPCGTTADCDSGECARENWCYCGSTSLICYTTFWGGWLCENAEQCVSRICQTSPDRSQRCGCRTADDCGWVDPSAGRCQSGWCVATTGRYGNEPCSSGSECLSGGCRSGTCTCSTNEQCPNFSIGTEICQANRCVGTVSRCTSNADCASGVCLPRGSCGCNNDADCTIGGGGQCQAGECIIATTNLFGGTTEPVEFTSPIGQVSPGRFIGNAIKTVLGIIGAVALLMFVYGGLMWMTSGGSPEKIKKAQTTLVWAVLGMIVIFASYAAVDFVLRALGV